MHTPGMTDPNSRTLRVSSRREEFYCGPCHKRAPVKDTSWIVSLEPLENTHRPCYQEPRYAPRSGNNRSRASYQSIDISWRAWLMATDISDRCRSYEMVAMKFPASQVYSFYMASVLLTTVFYLVSMDLVYPLSC